MKLTFKIMLLSDIHCCKYFDYLYIFPRTNKLNIFVNEYISVFPIAKIPCDIINL